MKKSLIYWMAYFRGYRNPEIQQPRRPLTTELGRVEWWGLADGFAARVRHDSHPFCRLCGYQITKIHRIDPNLGILCETCGHARDVEAGRKLLEN